MTPREPPAKMIELARIAAMKSPCAKSKRGAVIWNGANLVVGEGWNAQPDGFVCTGDDKCRKHCGQLCSHAELTAITTMYQRMAASSSDWWDPTDCVLLHVKVVGDKVVAGGGPSCWQCSREILRLRFAGIWLYERTAPDCPSEFCPMCSGEDCNVCAASYDGEPCHHDVIDRHRDEPPPPPGLWCFYSSNNFHHATLRNCELPINRG